MKNFYYQIQITGLQTFVLVPYAIFIEDKALASFINGESIPKAI